MNPVDPILRARRETKARRRNARSDLNTGTPPRSTSRAGAGSSQPSSSRPASVSAAVGPTSKGLPIASMRPRPRPRTVRGLAVSRFWSTAIANDAIASANRTLARFDKVNAIVQRVAARQKNRGFIGDVVHSAGGVADDVGGVTLDTARTLGSTFPGVRWGVRTVTSTPVKRALGWLDVTARAEQLVRSPLGRGYVADIRTVGNVLGHAPVFLSRAGGGVVGGAARLGSGAVRQLDALGRGAVRLARTPAGRFVRRAAQRLGPLGTAVGAYDFGDTFLRFTQGEASFASVVKAGVSAAPVAGTVIFVSDEAMAVTGIDGKAHGGRVRGGEITLVGERGPELVKLPTGSDVVPAHRSRELLERVGAAAPRGEQRVLHVHQYLDGREIALSTISDFDDDEQWGWR
jgi:hypothetical protein